MDYSLEKMSASHRAAVIDIFNYFVTHSYAAYLEEAVDYPFFDHFLKMSRGYPALVLKTGDQRVVGFGFMRPHHLAESLKRAAEVTYFITPGIHPAGAGHRTARDLRARGQTPGHRFPAGQHCFPQ